MKEKICVISATFNADKCIRTLADSLVSQVDKEFTWIVADGLSSDKTVEILKSYRDRLEIVIDVKKDFGIYDALNRAVQLASSDYYVVAGADDFFHEKAIANYKRYVKSTNDADLITAKITVNGVVSSARKNSMEWMYGPFAHVSGHAIGLLIKRSLHDSVGFYSNKYPITADQKFILDAINSGAKVIRADFVAGEFSSDGTSGRDLLGALSESCRVQIGCGHNKLLQIIIFILRLIKNFKAIK